MGDSGMGQSGCRYTCSTVETEGGPGLEGRKCVHTCTRTVENMEGVVRTGGW